ncbi:hypothetical protein Acr_12g0005090 [Actinidia rufa]|uniref:Uncharacterized protein n=1 Tax=Actinidia rufa TaxID=165716 RepID=A0A7J0FGZ8_9ERIC|nr:hypothetical protein Acr_12g0005090 [Actinidia rufa]
MKMSSESGKALKTLAMAIKTVTNPSSSSIHIENSKVAIDELKTAMDDALRERFDLLKILLHRGIVKPVSDSNGGGDGGDHVIIQVHEKSLDSPENGNPRASKTSSRDDVL